MYLYNLTNFILLCLPDWNARKAVSTALVSFCQTKSNVLNELQLEKYSIISDPRLSILTPLPPPFVAVPEITLVLAKIFGVE